MSERYAFISGGKADFEVSMMCRMLGVSRSGYYEWLDRPVSARATRRLELTKRIRSVFVGSGRTYGYRRVHAELARAGVEVDDELVRRLMAAAGLVPVQVKRQCRSVRASAEVSVVS
ncbi:IS3 family transposase [Micromonospora sp. NBC_01699]|uniref:IS3 family transposase n=1 Tax=Micromonospora sp. NBC_01699 TaxID=2975984 RepID=UPI002E27F52A|nr:IS3 family transposase [Micromonospora sp. NBC_01699]